MEGMERICAKYDADTSGIGKIDRKKLGITNRYLATIGANKKTALLVDANAHRSRPYRKSVLHTRHARDVFVNEPMLDGLRAV